MVVQERPTHTLEFSTSSIIPGSGGSSGILPALHMTFPPTILPKDATTAGTLALGGRITAVGTPAWSKDTTSNYDDNCQVYLCYLITFVSTNDVASGTTTATTTSLQNPESVATAGNIKLTTMMKYTNDALYSKIDESTVASNFKATAGTIASSSMKPVSVTANMYTFADNQVYTLTYKATNHKVFRAGFIKVQVPSAYKISSEATAVAQFQVLDSAGGKSYASIYKASAADRHVIGSVTSEMQGGVDYTITIGGL